MKLALTAALALTLSGPALAEMPREACQQIAELAHSVMVVRQDGNALHDAVAFITSGDDALDGPVLDLTLALLEKAYAEPLYSSDGYKAEAAAEFSSAAYLMCREAR